MKKIVLLIVTLLLFFVESILLSKLQIMGVTIPLTLIFGLAVSVVGDEWDAMFMGIITGFLHDVYSPRFYGIHMFLNLWIFYFTCIVSRRLRRDKNILMALLIGLAALIKYLVYFIFMKFAGVITISDNIPILTLFVFFVGILCMFLVKKLYDSPWIKVWNK